MATSRQRLRQCRSMGVLGRGDEGRLRDGVPFFIAENISSISKGGQVAARTLKKRNGGGLANFF